MPELSVALFAEDRGHAEFADVLVKRIGREEGVKVRLRVVSWAGGHGRAFTECKIYQRSVIRSIASVPNVVLVVIDGNCAGWNEARGNIRNAIDPELRVPVVSACPDPHIERWYLADPESFHQVVGASIALEKRKCERDRYKAQLIDAVRKGGNIPTLGGIEFARELVDAMDFYRAGQNEPSLRAFVDDTRASILQLSV